MVYIMICPLRVTQSLHMIYTSHRDIPSVLTGQQLVNNKNNLLGAPRTFPIRGTINEEFRSSHDQFTAVVVERSTCDTRSDRKSVR